MKKDKRLLRKIYRKKTLDNIDKKIKLLGSNYKYDAINYLNIKIILTILITIYITLSFDKGYILGPLSGILFYFGIEYIYFDYRIKKRISKIDYEALFYFEVLTLTLESGRNLKGALELTSSYIDSEISDEFKKTINEVKLGKSLNEALNDMKERIPSETINTVILNITQSNMFGNSIIESLNNQVDFLREKKISEVKGIINKLPVKISILSVIFLIPIMLLLILAPVVIDFFN